MAPKCLGPRYMAVADEKHTADELSATPNRMELANKRTMLSPTKMISTSPMTASEFRMQ